eukprot:SAG31_NODE_10762_length_1101_cov_0.862275_1_plen_103_part_00
MPVQHLAALKGHAELVDLLLRSGANATARTALGRTPLHLAAMGGSAASAKLLLEHPGVEPDTVASARTGETALHMAALHGYGDVVAVLLKAGADVRRVGAGL